MSRPFTFRLERVLEVRERTEGKAREDLAATLRHAREGSELLAAAETALAMGRDSARAAAADPGTGGAALIAQQAYLERASRMARAAALDLDRREAEVGARRGALAAAARDKQVLERLKERHRSEHELETLQIEGALIDEMALAVHRRSEAVR